MIARPSVSGPSKNRASGEPNLGDLNGMSRPVLPRVTYSFEVQTLTKNSVESDDNSGQCYSVTVPPS